ncbi:hypothetical protein F7725_002283 [Dissostichus mawsoni]|uniref:Ig-like domain-containing protein n=1 Tax=Dissostichus mawsoni TaxID=36200 RepID=A0A7J5Y1Z1_DISMA|nr:hypothetical protein F7725_002283 [Dissostichus mawsoni]
MFPCCGRGSPWTSGQQQLLRPVHAALSCPGCSRNKTIFIEAQRTDLNSPGLNMNTMKVLALPLLITLMHIVLVHVRRRNVMRSGTASEAEIVQGVVLFGLLTVSSSKPKVEVHEHTDAVLACEFRTEKDQNPRIEWKKKGMGVTFVYFNHKFTGQYASRAKMEGATLTFHSVSQKDSGEYRCEVTASEDHVSLGEATVTLNVLVPPHVPSCEVPSSVFVGSGLELQCKDKLSVPPATYRWSVTKIDAGMYRCESSNSVGAPKSCVARQLKVIDCKRF